jgi:hypothetical protein
VGGSFSNGRRHNTRRRAFAYSSSNCSWLLALSAHKCCVGRRVSSTSALLTLRRRAVEGQRPCIGWSCRTWALQYSACKKSTGPCCWRRCCCAVPLCCHASLVAREPASRATHLPDAHVLAQPALLQRLAVLQHGAALDAALAKPLGGRAAAGSWAQRTQSRARVSDGVTHHTRHACVCSAAEAHAGETPERCLRIHST